jgi:molecular chaperone DnaK
MPMVRQKFRDRCGMEPKNEVDPGKAVALGATIQGGLITGETEDAVLLDVTPLTLGIEVQGGIFEPLIPRNSTLPTEASKIYTTSKTNQKSVYIRVFQGEEPIADQNEFLGEFVLSGIPKAEAGTPEIEVTFRIDLDGILHVTAEDLASGNYDGVKIKGGSGIAGDDLEELMERQEEKRRQSQQQKKRNRLKTRGGELIEQGETAIKDTAVELSIEMANTIQTEIENTEKILNEDNFDITAAQDQIDTLEYVVGQTSVFSSPSN